MAEPDLPKLLSISEAARQLGVTRQTLYRWMREGMPYMDAAGVRKVNPEKVSQWLEAQEPNPDAKEG